MRIYPQTKYKYNLPKVPNGKLSYAEASVYICQDNAPVYDPSTVMVFSELVDFSLLSYNIGPVARTVVCDLPKDILVSMLNHEQLKQLLVAHEIPRGSDRTRADFCQKFMDHRCEEEASPCKKTVVHLIPKDPHVFPTSHTSCVPRLMGSSKKLHRRKKLLLTFSDIEPYIFSQVTPRYAESVEMDFVNYSACSEGNTFVEASSGTVLCELPLHYLAPTLGVRQLVNVLRCHNVERGVPQLEKLLSKAMQHDCVSAGCPSFLTFMQPRDRNTVPLECNGQSGDSKVEGTHADFPPDPASKKLIHEIVTGFVEETDPSACQEKGCIVCGQLTPFTLLEQWTPEKYDINLLVNDASTRKEREAVDEPVSHIPGPVLAPGCSDVCLDCIHYLQRGKTPPLALCNGLWVGEIPDALKDLTFAEQRLIARVRHNVCVVRVAEGRGKLSANAVMFANPTLKVYRVLPPSKQEMDEVLAYVFLGPTRPTMEQFKRTPMLVRRDKVLRALEWLKLNHVEYADLEISLENLNTYEHRDVPCTVEWKRTSPDDDEHVNPLATSVHDNDAAEFGTEDGPCPFRVHGLTGEEYDQLTLDEIKFKAYQHMESGGKVLGVGHSKEPESMYDNPRAYPSMFPWLYPYGLGGFSNAEVKKTKLGEPRQTRHRLMYYDKRFQVDQYFPLVAFNHSQIKDCTTGSYLTTKRKDFDKIAQRLMSLNPNVIGDMAKRLEAGEGIKPKTEEEIQCLRVLNDLDHVGGHVKGSLTGKKYMRSEIWSLIANEGAPTWFVTLSPTDLKHPLCLYYADSEPVFQAEMKTKADRERLIANNPVAAARFFHKMVTQFIKHVLGVGSDHEGVFGETSAYYGTVEQQGRLTLHLHLLIWIKGALPPQSIREKLLGKDAEEFKKKLFAYLESCHQGFFASGSLDDVRHKFPKESTHIGSPIHDSITDSPVDHAPLYHNPTETLPCKPPPFCSDPPHENCDACQKWWTWYKMFEDTVDDLVAKSNVHSHLKEVKSSDPNRPSKYERKGCQGKNGVCRARFPRKIVQESSVDPETGSIEMKQLESMVNAVTRVTVYLLRCNTDTSCMLSGTAIKAVTVYVTNYITKPALKSHHVMNMMKDIVQGKFEELTSEPTTDHECARTVLRQITNALTSKLEIGSPMAALYLLGNPDHYTSHNFKLCWWKSYVSFINSDINNVACDEKAEDSEVEDGIAESFNPDKVIIRKNGTRYTALSCVDEYRFRPSEYEDMSVVDWVTQSSTMKCPRNREPGKNWHRFQTGFPDPDLLVKVKQISEVNTVPNFVGGSLPRRDSEARDIYCSTMLALLVPWRTSNDLKGNDKSWEESFDQYNFPPRCKRLMDNFNVIHECYDAKDDFFKQLKDLEAETRSGHAHGSFNANDCLSDDDDGGEYDDTAVEEFYLVGKKESKHRREMAAIETVVRDNRWTTAGDLTSTAEAECYSSQMGPAYWKKMVTSTRDAELARRRQSPEQQKSRQTRRYPTIRAEDVDRVDVIDARGHFNPKYQEEAEMLVDLKTTIVNDFSLNEDQERAFRIVADHASSIQTEPLTMYLGGVGGTGKSQVIRAISAFFEARGESRRFMVMGPTGSAAAAINGSTYHWALGIRGTDEDGSTTDTTSLRKAKENLEYVEYIFIDEISMVGCKELYKISARLAKLKDPSKPFGGMNVILAGDFAQLSPVKSDPLWYHIRLDPEATTSSVRQQPQIGRAVWLQILTVVILTKNMRQTEDTEDDKKFRRTLHHARYGACDDEDIEWLYSRIAGPGPTQPNLGDEYFRNKAIIVKHNAERDRLNDLGVECFARSTGREIFDFFSEDTLPSATKASTKTKKRLGTRTQNMLWDSPPGSSDHLPGKLRVVVGMPVILRHNDATELCITKGQEGTVYGWDASTSEHDPHVSVLNTLFVKLTNPKKTVQIGDLPENVVPITRVTRKIKCRLPNDSHLSISRTQVEVLPFFAMTDFASQGKTRPFNPVDLKRCTTSNAMYTCLSRGTSASGTIIVRGFSPDPLRSGIHGWLRQEFRELEMLNEITRLKYRGELPSFVRGNFRSELLRSFKEWKGADYLPATIPDALKWGNDPAPTMLPPIETTPVWRFTSDETSALTTKASSVNPITVKGKRARDAVYSAWEDDHINKRSKIANCHKSAQRVEKREYVLIDGILDDAVDGDRVFKRPRPEYPSHDWTSSVIGPLWDDRDWSCGYDCMIAIMWNLWVEKGSESWFRTYPGADEQALSVIVKGFREVALGDISLDDVRDNFRLSLNRSDAVKYPLGRRLVALDALFEGCNFEYIRGMSEVLCSRCNMYEIEDDHVVMSAMVITDARTPGTVDHPLVANLTDWFSLRSTSNSLSRRCKSCGTHDAKRLFKYTYIPKLLCMSVATNNLNFEAELKIPTLSGDIAKRHLIGLVYAGNDHFTCRIVKKNGEVWFFDGMLGKRAQYEGMFNDMKTLSTRNTTSLAGVLYAE